MQLRGTRTLLQQQPPPKNRFPHIFSLLGGESENSQQADLATALPSAEPLSAVGSDRLWHRPSCKLFRAIELLPSRRPGKSGPLASLSACSHSCPCLTLNIVFPHQATRTRKPQGIADQTRTHSSYTQSLSHMKQKVQRSPCTHHANGPFANGPGK